MSYNKHTWATGNVVGAVDLNRMEQGIEDAGNSGSGEVLVVNAVYNENDDSYTLDKTWQEIYDAFPFVAVYINTNEELIKNNIVSVGIYYGNYIVEAGLSLTTNFASGYPTTANPGGGNYS